MLRIGPGHRGALMTRAETSPPEQENEFLPSVEPDRLGQREKREIERERKRERERERESLCLSLSQLFSADHPQRAAREYGAPAGGGNQGCGVRGGVKTR